MTVYVVTVDVTGHVVGVFNDEAKAKASAMGYWESMGIPEDEAECSVYPCQLVA